MQMAISVATLFSPNHHQLLCFPSSSTQYLKTHHFHNQRFIPRIPFSSFRNNNPLPETECPVPLDQQPVNEFKALSDSFPFSWASGDLVEYCSRLFATGLAFALFVGLPVNLFGSAGPIPEPLKPFLGAVSGGLIVVTLAVVRMYLGWAYVGNRLLSATVECTHLSFSCWIIILCQLITLFFLCLLADR